MIIGIGVDLVDIRRIKRILLRFGERFTYRCFTDVERLRADKMKWRYGSYAKAFAAKEACAKALGLGISAGVTWKDLCVIYDCNGKPHMKLTGSALLYLHRLTPPNTVPQIDLSLADEYPLIQAFIILSCRHNGSA